MANYKQVSYGSQGGDVTELQKLLNKNGYNLDADGIYGGKTQAAVKDYQKKSGLIVDGIAGKNTWSSLTTGSKKAASGDTGSTGDTGFKYNPYQQSDVVTKAQEILNQHMQNRPGEYQSQWQSQLNDILGKILNREEFSYDLNGDALYQQYKDQYMNQGQMAMMDTMGQAAAMTGGYGNSYAQSVGQQAYNSYLQGLNDKVPELYQLALSKYNQEGQNLQNQFALVGAMEDQEYGRYRDKVGDWESEYSRLQDRYDTERDYDYGRWADDRNFEYGRWTNDRNYRYQQERDKISDEQWEREFEEAKRRYDQEWDMKYGSRGGRTGGTGGEGGPDNPENSPGAGETEAKMEEYVRRMLNNGRSTQFNPEAVIKGNSSLTNEERQVALEILDAYISGGYMKLIKEERN